MSDFDSTAATAAAAEEFREQLEQELTIDRLLERPERKYTGNRRGGDCVEIDWFCFLFCFVFNV
jgi:hypothetical protein